MTYFQNLFTHTRKQPERNIYLVSHGEASTKHSPEAHDALTSDGREQARMLARRLKQIDIEGVVTSSTPCASETAYIISTFNNVPRQETQLLAHRRMPSDYIRAEPDSTEQKRIRTAMRTANRLGRRYADEETFTELKERVTRALDQIIFIHSASNLLIVSHPQTMRALLGMMLLGNEFSIDVFFTFNDVLLPTNTGITWCSEIGGSWKLRTWNDHAHLG